MGWTWQSDGPEGMPYLVWRADAPVVSASSPTTAPPPPAAAAGSGAPGMFDDLRIRKLQGQSDAPAAPSLWEAPSGSMTGQQAYGEQPTYRDSEGQVWAINPRTGQPERMLQGYHGDGLSDFFDVSGNAPSGGGLDPYEGFHYYFESDPNVTEDALARGFKIKSSDKEKQRTAMLGSLVLGGLTSIAGASLPGMLGFGAAPAYARPAAQIGVNALRSGDLEQAIENYVMGAGMGYGADFVAPYVNDAIDWGSDFAFGGAPAGAEWGDPSWSPDSNFHSPAPQPNTLLADGTLAYGMPSGEWGDPSWSADPDFHSPAPRPNVTLPDGTAAYGTPGMLTSGAASLTEGSAPTAESPPQTSSQLTGDDLQRYIKTAQKVDELLGALEGAPTRGEGETDEQHQQELVDYLGLDSATMAEAGLVPGTPEYMEYILAQADAIIEQTMGDLDIDSEDFAAQLRAKTEEEQEQLQRALYVRGQLDLMMGSGTYTDPFSGSEQEVEGDSFNPSVAAYQRGRAADIDALAGMEGEDALGFLKNLLGRNADLFGMQERADARFEQAKNEELLDPRRKRRGMLSY